MHTQRSRGRRWALALAAWSCLALPPPAAAEAGPATAPTAPPHTGSAETAAAGATRAPGEAGSAEAAAGGVAPGERRGPGEAAPGGTAGLAETPAHGLGGAPAGNSLAGNTTLAGSAPITVSAGGAPREADAVLVGSSSFNQSFGRIIARELTRRGFQVIRKGVSGSGLARPDFRDMHQVLENLPIGPGTEVVVMYLGVNDTQAVWLPPHERGSTGASTVPFGTPEWDVIYTLRARQFLDRICQRGAQRAIVLLPVDVNLPDMQRRLDRIRELQTLAASSTTCAAAISTAGDAGQFDAGGMPKRMADGFHMTAVGAQIVWNRIERRVMELLDTDADPFGI